MTTIQAKLAVIIAVLLFGIGTGWYVHGKFDQAQISKEQRAQIDLANKRADERVADERKAKQDAESKLAGEQASTAAFNAWLNKSRATTSSLAEQIFNATFQPVEPPHSASDPQLVPARCPRPAIASPDFMRLYASAAHGTAPGPDD